MSNLFYPISYHDHIKILCLLIKSFFYGENTRKSVKPAKFLWWQELSAGSGFFGGKNWELDQASLVSRTERLFKLLWWQELSAGSSFIGGKNWALVQVSLVAWTERLAQASLGACKNWAQGPFLWWQEQNAGSSFFGGNNWVLVQVYLHSFDLNYQGTGL